MSAFCYSCRAELGDYQGYMTSYCATCQSRMAIEKQMKESAQAAEENAERMASEQASRDARNARLQEDLHYQSIQSANRNAELARKEAKENARLAAEGQVSYDDAYKYGFHFLESLDKEYIYGTLSEDGTINIPDWVVDDSNYKLEHLKQAFKRGLKDSVKEIPNVDFSYMKEQAYRQGYLIRCVQHGSFLISFKNSLFNSSTEFKLCHQVRVVDLNTGHVSYTYENPFKSEELNQCFRDGIDAHCAEENTAEKIANRMATEVADTLAKQAEEARIAEEKVRVAKEKKLAKEELNRVERAESAREYEKRESERNVRKIIVAVFLVVIAGFIIGLWIIGHPVFSILAGFVTFCGLIVGGGVGALQDYVNKYHW